MAVLRKKIRARYAKLGDAKYTSGSTSDVIIFVSRGTKQARKESPVLTLRSRSSLSAMMAKSSIYKNVICFNQM